jgi:exonuclease VII large subunit
VGTGAATQPVEPAPAATPPVVTAATSSAGTPTAPSLSDIAPDPAAATPSTAAADTSSTVVHVTLAISGPAAPALTRTQQALLDAFGTLQTARGKPKAEDEDDKSLRAQLSAFLQELADELRLGDENTADATRPGALLHVTA